MTSADTTPPEPSLQKRFLNWRTLLSFAIAAGLIAFTIWKLDIDLAEVWGYLRRANPFLYALGFLAFYITFPLRAWRWRLLMENAAVGDDEAPALPRLFDLTEIIFLSWFANCIVPAKLGDLYRGYLLKRTTGASFSRTVGTIFAERVLDMLLLFILMIAASMAVFGPRIPQDQSADFSPTMLYAGGVVLVAIAVGVLLALRQYRGAQVASWWLCLVCTILAFRWATYSSMFLN